MKTIKRADGKQVGKFKEADLEVLDDRYQVLGTVYPYSALGEHTIVDYVETIDPAELEAKQIELQREIIGKTQERLDSFAQARGYDSILSACTYVASQVPRFASDGLIAVRLRDATWAKLYEILGEVETQKRPIPSDFGDIEADLPALIWESA